MLARAMQTDPVVIRRIMGEPRNQATYGPPRAWQHRMPKRNLATIALPGVEAALGRAGTFLEISLADFALPKPLHEPTDA